MYRSRRAFPVAYRLILAAVLVEAGAVGAATGQSADTSQAPFGDMVSARIASYDRVAPQVATSAPLDRLGIIEAKAVGFRSIVDLQSSQPASTAEQRAAEFALLAYHNLPVADRLPTRDQVAAFARLIEDPENQPVLVHGASLDQAAAMWALYRAAGGVPPEVAIGDGRTAGLGESEPAVRQRLGLPTATQ